MKFKKTVTCQIWKLRTKIEIYMCYFFGEKDACVQVLLEQTSVISNKNIT